jgi:hypothetical protein
MRPPKSNTQCIRRVEDVLGSEDSESACAGTSCCINLAGLFPEHLRYEQTDRIVQRA